MKQPRSTEKIENYLASLTKEELISLILKLAPRTFLDAINAQFASQREAKTIFRKAAKAIEAILSDERFGRRDLSPTEPRQVLSLFL